MRQMTIFDFIPSELETTPIETIVERISAALGMKFQWNEYLEEYQCKNKGIEVTFGLSRYFSDDDDVTSDEPTGDLFIGIGVEYKAHGGMGCPCDSIDEAIDTLKRNIERFRRYKKANNDESV